MSCHGRTIHMKRQLFLFIMFASALSVQPEEQLIYCVIQKGSSYVAENTDIYAVNPDNAMTRILFSDEGSPIVLRQQLYVFHFPVMGGNKLFAHAAARGTLVPFPGNASLYELALNGSNSFRKITAITGDESVGDILANSNGTRIGYLNRQEGKLCLFIHEVSTGTLLNQINMTETFLDCYAAGIGWLSQSTTLYFSLQVGDADVYSEESYSRQGTYLLDENGTGLIKLAELPVRPGFYPPENVRMIGVLPTNEYVFEMTLHRNNIIQGAPQTVFSLVKWNPETYDCTDISFDPKAGPYSGIQVNYQLSPSGKYLAAARLPVSSSAVSCDIWLKDLQNGKEKILLSIPIKGLQGPFLGLVGWISEK
jgi:hypothetical protein